MFTLSNKGQGLLELAVIFALVVIVAYGIAVMTGVASGYIIDDLLRFFAWITGTDTTRGVLG